MVPVPVRAKVNLIEGQFRPQTAAQEIENMAEVQDRIGIITRINIEGSEIGIDRLKNANGNGEAIIETTEEIMIEIMELESPVQEWIKIRRRLV